MRRVGNIHATRGILGRRLVITLLSIALLNVIMVLGKSAHSAARVNTAKAKSVNEKTGDTKTLNVLNGTAQATLNRVPKANGKIVFTSSRDINQEIYSMYEDGTGLTRLTNNSAPDNEPVWSPDGTRIAFISQRDGNDELYVMNADGSNPVRLTNNSDRDGTPTWSPDGKRIAFVSYENSLQICLINADGSGFTLLNSGFGALYPSWSPDGTQIAYASNANGHLDVFVMSADGATKKNITNAVGDDLNPSWSPDGRRIVFESNRDGNNEIYSMNADGSNQTRLTNDNAGDERPVWSPDGTKITFDSDRDGNQEIYVMNADGTGQTRRTNEGQADVDAHWQPLRANGRIAFTSDRDGDNEIYSMFPDGSGILQLTSHGAEDAQPAFSPDGAQIVFSSGRNDNLWQVYVMNSDGSNVRRLTNSGGNDMTPSWSPDGKKIVFASDRDANLEIYAINADGTNEVRLTNDTHSDITPAWSADGKRIAFNSDRDGDQEIYVMNADGSDQKNLTNNTIRDEGPAWSPDSTRIVFVSYVNDIPTLFLMSADGSNPVSINRRGLEPAWSPDASQLIFEEGIDGSYELVRSNLDGTNLQRLTTNPAADFAADWGAVTTEQRIAFNTDRDGDAEIYVMYADGSLPTNLTHNSATDESPAWSPDGAKLAFHSGRDGQFEIYSMNADGSNQTRLTNNPATDNHPVWSPDGKRIAFDSDRDGNQEIYVMNADGTGQTRLTNNSADELRPAWSPDGTRIAFQSTRDGHNEVYVIKVDGTGETRLTQGSADNYLPAWSPDGIHLAFTSLRDGNAEIYLMNADGTGQINLSHNSAHDTRPSWSADGTKLVFHSSRDNNNAEVYVMNADGTGQTRLTDNPAKDDEPAWRPEIGPPTFTISGRITESGSGAGGVTVALSGATQATTTTDSNGNYSFTKLVEGSYTVTPSKTAYSFTPQSKSFADLVSNQTADFTATLVTYTVSGTIKHGQNPLGDVKVVLDDGGQGIQVFTDNNGFYSLTVKAGTNLTITPSKDFYTFTPSSFSFSNLNTNLTVDFTAKQDTFTISGHIVDGLTNSLAGVTVILSGTSQASTTTDSNGNYSFKDLTLGGNYTITPSKSQYDFNPQSESFQNLSANKTSDFQGTLKSYKLAGKIKDAEGKALANIVVSFKNGAGTDMGSVVSDQNGGYELSVPALDNYTVTPAATAFYVFTPASQTVNNLGNDQALSDFTGNLVNYSITGRITDGGNRLNGVTVTLSGGKTDSVKTDSNGDYTFVNVPASRTYTVTAAKQNYTFSPAQREIVNLDGNRADNDFLGTLVKYGISGQINDSNGNALPNVSVTIQDDKGKFGTSLSTDAFGQYHFTNVPAEGNYTITPTLTNYGFTPEKLVFSSLSANVNTANFTGALLRYTISGQVGGNGPIAGATVTLTGSQTGSTVTDGNGNYFFSNLQAKGNYTVTVSKANYTFQQASKTFNDLSQNEVANFNGTRNFYAITAHIKDGNGAPMVNIAVSISSAGQLLVVNSTDNSGQVTFVNLQAERDYVLAPTLSGWSFNPASKTVANLSNNETVEFTGTQLTSSISGQITLAGNGAPVAGATVTLSGDRAATATTDATGKYSFGQLPVGGNYTITPSKTNFTFDPPSQNVQNLSGNQEVSFTATGVTYSITGQVSNELGLFIAGVTVSLTGATNATTTTDGNGNYGFFNLTAGGNYLVTPSLGGYNFAPSSKSFENLSGDQNSIDFKATTAPSIGITGRITEGDKGIAGVTITLSGSQSKTAMTDSNGVYGFDGLTADGTYTVRPELHPYTFAPDSRTFTHLSATQSGVNFSGTSSAAALEFSQASYNLSEGSGSLSIDIRRTGNPGSAVAVNYATTDAAGLQNCDVTNGIASPRCDFVNVLGTLYFAPGETLKTIFLPVVDDTYVEGPETFNMTLSNPTGGAGLGATNNVTITVMDNDNAAAPNPIDNTEFFVRQHYLDFLGREPDPASIGWVNQINQCVPLQPSCDRLSVSQGIYLSPEFKERGYFIYKFYAVALGRKPSYDEFVADRARVSGFQNDAQLEQSKQDFIADFMSRTEFAPYNGLNNDEYVQRLLQTAGVTQVTIDGIAYDLNGLKTVMANGNSRGRVLRWFVESPEVSAKFLVESTIVMHYFGYLRRDPDGAYQDWITIYNQTGDARNVTNGFINSAEYRMRFGH